MSERKAINKYYPPDYDPAAVPKKKAKTTAQKVRLMLPYSMKCLSCNEYMAARRKFNARKETTSESYMGIKVIRFHIKCPRCNTSLSFQTDPKSASFVPVSGVARNYESLAPAPVKQAETEEEIFARLEKEEQDDAKFHEQQRHRKNNPFWQAREEGKDAMANLEEKLLASQREQQLHDELKALTSRQAKINSRGQEMLEQAQKRLKTESENVSLKRESVVSAEPKKPTLSVSKTITVKRPKKAEPNSQEASRENKLETQNITKSKSPEKDSKSPEKDSKTPEKDPFAGYSSD